MKKYGLGLSLIFLSLSAWAGHRIGNGGNGWFHENKLYLLDFCEAHMLCDEQSAAIEMPAELRGPKPFPSVPATLSVQLLADQKILDLQAKYPKLSCRLHMALRDLFWSTRSHIQICSDSNDAPLDVLLGLVGIACQENGLVEFGENDFQRLPPSNQAGLLVHEAIYFMVSQMNVDSSWRTNSFVRKINACIFFQDTNALFPLSAHTLECEMRLQDFEHTL